MAPDATRAPPTPSTARNDTCTAKNAAVPASAVHLELRTPSRHETSAAARMTSASRSSAPDALTVRNAPRIRSSAAPIAPTASCAALVARWIWGSRMTRMTATHDHHAERHAQQRQVQPCHQDDHRDQGQGRGDAIHDGAGRDLAQQHGVRGHPRHQVAGSAALHGGHAQPQHPAHQVEPGRQDHRLRGPAEDVLRDGAQHGGHHQEHGQHHQDLGDGQARSESGHQLPSHERLRERSEAAGQGKEPGPDDRLQVWPAYPPSVRQVALDVALRAHAHRITRSSPGSPMRSTLQSTHRDIS